MNTFAPEDLFKLQFLQDGVFSPDGTKVLYTVSHVDTAVDKERMTIRLHDLESGTDRQMTNGNALDHNPAFSPDGKTIAFLSDRNKKLQLYAMPVDGGEPKQLTDLKQGVASGAVFSPDGKTIAFTAVASFEGDNPPDLTKEVYRVTRHVYRFDAVGYLDQNVKDIYLLDVASNEVRQLTDTEKDCSQLKWSPDGQKLMYLSGMHPDSFMMLRNDISVIDLNGKVETFTDETIGVQSADWLPSGNKILYLGRPMIGVPIGTKSDLWVLDLGTGQTTNRSGSLAVGSGGSLSLRMPTRIMSSKPFKIVSDEHAYFRIQEGGNLHVYQLALSGEEQWRPIITGERAVTLLDWHNGRMLLAETNINTPPNLIIANDDGSAETQLTHINQSFLSEMTLPESENLHFKGQDGVDVEGWYMKPPNGTAPYPTILYIHGGPHAAYGNGFAFDFHMLTGQGYGVLFINHRASTGYGNEFSTAIKGDWGNLDYGDLMAGVDYAIEQGLADGDRLGCCGTSGGGNLSSWIVGNTRRFKAAVPQNPVTNWVSFYGCSDIGVWFGVAQMGGHPHEIPEVYAKCSPITYAHTCTTPTLMVQSEHDWRCPAEQSEQFYTVLKANGCTVEMLRQPGGSHGASIIGEINLRREHLLAMLDWFNRYV